MKFRVIAMVLTGFALAIGLLWASQFVRGNTSVKTANTAEAEPEKKPIAIRPPSFTSVSEINGTLRMSGKSEPATTLVLSQGGKRLGETKSDNDGLWTSTLPINRAETQAVSLIMLLEDGTRVRSEETLFRIPQIEEDINAEAPEAAIDIPASPFTVPTLIFLTTPGGPSLVFKSPFGGSPISGPLSLGPIDYDDSGGAVFRGSSERAGRVRLYANGIVIGDAPVQQSGEWFYIIAETLPRGSYDVVVALMNGTEEITRITVPFEKMAFVESDEPGGGLYVAFGERRWQVRRDLLGGGAQYTALFGPVAEK